MLWPTRLKFSWGDGGYHGVVYHKFGEDQSNKAVFVFKKAKNGILARKIHGATGLKLGMHTQLDSGSNMG